MSRKRHSIRAWLGSAVLAAVAMCGVFQIAQLGGSLALSIGTRISIWRNGLSLINESQSYVTGAAVAGFLGLALVALAASRLRDVDEL